MYNFKEFHNSEELQEATRKPKPKPFFGKAASTAIVGASFLGGPVLGLGLAGGILAAKGIHSLLHGFSKNSNKNKETHDDYDDNDTDNKVAAPPLENQHHYIDFYKHNPRKLSNVIENGKIGPEHTDAILNHIDKHQDSNDGSTHYKHPINLLAKRKDLTDQQAFRLSRYHNQLESSNYNKLTEHKAFEDSKYHGHLVNDHSKRSGLFVAQHKNADVNHLNELSNSKNKTVALFAKVRLNKIKSANASSNQSASGSSSSSATNTATTTPLLTTGKPATSGVNPKTNKIADIHQYINDNQTNPAKLRTLLSGNPNLNHQHITRLTDIAHQDMSGDKKRYRMKGLLNDLASKPSKLSDSNARYIGLHHQHLTDTNFKLLGSHQHFESNNIGGFDNDAHDLRSVKHHLSKAKNQNEHLSILKAYSASKQPGVNAHITTEARKYTHA